MPFDGSGEKPEVQIIDRARGLIATPATWRKGGHQDDGRYCVLSALFAATITFGFGLDVYCGLAGKLSRILGGRMPSAWNDDARTIHADVLALLDLVREELIECPVTP